ncbi:D-alanyl-D-alanine carboxypeptidase family protein, partial [Chitinimonas sp.]|uniref:D-alanyl-D-alanine carboxypeptidase family protein n=1 Tax=Chitinimonas sp. TaxID=1934313 RepID=UPI0035AD95D1
MLAELGISETYLAGRGLALQEQASLLMPLGVDLLGRDQFATPEAGLAWIAMRQAALDAGVELQLVSAFRSIDYQAGIIRRKLAGGLDLNTILQV